MLQDGLLIGNAPDFALSLKGEEIFHKVSVAVWRHGLKMSPFSLYDRGLKGLRKKVMDFVTAKTDFGKLVSGVNDFGICEVPARGIKITVKILWNQRLSPESIEALKVNYQDTFFPFNPV